MGIITRLVPGCTCTFNIRYKTRKCRVLGELAKSSVLDCTKNREAGVFRERASQNRFSSLKVYLQIESSGFIGDCSVTAIIVFLLPYTVCSGLFKDLARYVVVLFRVARGFFWLMCVLTCVAAAWILFI